MLLVVVSLALVAGAPPAGVLGSGPAPFSLSRVLSWLAAPFAWAAPQPMPPTPVQQTGTARDKEHYVSAALTRVGTGNGRPPGKGIGELPAYQPHTLDVAAHTPPAPHGEHSFDPATSTRIPSASAATTDVYRNADGTYTRKIYAGPVNYRAPDGSWQPIDTTLERRPDGRFRERANSLVVDLAARADDAVLASLRVDASRAIGYSLQGAAASAGVAAGSQLTYRGVLTDTDLVVSPLPAGLKESLVLHSADAPTSWLFPLRLQGLTPRLGADGSVEFVDQAGAVVERVPPGFMRDSHIDPKSGEAAESMAVTYRLETVDGAPALRMSVDSAWLHDRARVFPVVVDPTYNTTSSTYAQNSFSGDHSGDTELKTGTWDSGTDVAHTFLSFVNFGYYYGGNRVTTASLNLFDIWAYTCTAKPFSVNPITQGWTASGVTAWPGPAIGGAIGSLTANPGAACTNTNLDLNTGVWMSVPLTVDTINTWTTGGSNFGLAVTASLTDSTQWKKFASVNTSHPPYLSFTYTPDAVAQIDTQYPPDNYAATTLTPELLASGHDPDSWPGALQYDFTVFSTSGSQLATSNLTSAGSWVVPSGVLSWGQSYLWTVQAYDGYTYSNPVYYLLSTPVPQPLVTSGLSQNGGGHGFDPSIGNYTTSATDAQVATVGPSLAVQRDYNSRDPRTSGAFGAGWSSIVDAKAPEVYAPGGAVATVVLTYPDGQEVAFGRNGDGTFSPPSGRFASFVSVTGGGYRLTDKNDTVYTFTQPTGTTGSYGLTSVIDAAGRAENLTYTAGQVSTVTSAVSGRALHFTWSTPSGASYPHVASVQTDPVTPGVPSSALTWTYTYTGDQLSTVCPPSSPTACTGYGYTAGSQYPTSVLDLGPHSYWRLNEASGTTAASSVLVNEGVDNGTYTNVTLGQPGPLPGSTATAAGFNGTSSSVRLPASLVSGSSYQSLSMWFKTTTGNGVLFSYQADPIGNGTTAGNYTPALYVGSDGRLFGEFWYSGGVSPISTATSVANGAWHHVALTAAGNTQSMYLDGALVGSKSGAIQVTGQLNNYVGAGFVGGWWPDEPHYNTGDNTGYATYFTGSIADVAFFTQPLAASAVAQTYQAGSRAAQLLTSVTRPSGRNYATVSYDGATGRVSQVVDENGATSRLAAPTVTGSSQVYVSSVLAGSPIDYWRLNDPVSCCDDMVTPHDDAWGDTITLGVPGPFADATAVGLSGASTSFLDLADNALVRDYGNEAVSLWFKTSVGNGVLFSYQASNISNGTTGGDYTPALYVGSDGKLLGQYWCDCSGTPITTSGSVADGRWHHVVLSAGTNSQALYLDGALVGTKSGTVHQLNPSVFQHAYVGAGFLGGAWPDEPHYTLSDNTGYATFLTGSVAEVAYYYSELSAGQAAQQWGAYKSSSGVSPVSTVAVTDPGGRTISHLYDALNGNRQIKQVDGLGGTTIYGYDVGGFLNTVTDPDGFITATGHDVRGNVVSQTTCQDHWDNICSTAYYAYYPDDTSTRLSPDARNDLLVTARDARSASATDNTYATTYGYDAAGNRTGVTTPPVPGFPAGRTTIVSYTDGTTVAAADSGFAPPGLPSVTTSPGGARETVLYNRNGDVAQVTDPAGLVTRFTYDPLGRLLTKTVVSDSYPNGLTASYTYDGVGQVVSQTDPPVLNRVTGAVHTAQTTTSYDADGEVLSQTVADTTGGDASRTVSAAYNSLGELASSTDAAGKTTTYGYDVYGNRNRETNPAGDETDYLYDANGHLLTTTLKGYTGDPVNPSAPTDLAESSRAYDPAGRLSSVTDSMGHETRYVYYDDGLLAEIIKYGPTSGDWFTVRFNKYDAAGNLVRQWTNDQNTETDFTVDAAGRTTSSRLDPGTLNRTTTYAYSPDDAVLTTSLSAAGSTTFTTDATYDPLGRMTSRSAHNDGSGHPSGWWRLNETSGVTAADSSGSGQTGLMGAGATWSGGAALFNGSSGLVATAGPVLNTAQSYSVSAWVNLRSTANHSVAVAQGGSNVAAFDLEYSTSYGSWAFVAAGSDVASPTWPSAHSTGAPPLNTWVHLVGSFNSATGGMSLYVNGSLAGTGTDTTPWNASGPLSIGGMKLAGGATSSIFNGSISNVQVYPRALSSAEVSTLYSNGRTGGALATNRLTTSWSLDQRGAPLSMTDPNGNTTQYAYDEAGQLAVTTAPTVNTEVNGGAPTPTHPVTMVGYDTFGDRTEVSDANGNVTTVGYDAAGRMASRTLPAYTPPGSSTAITATETRTYTSLGQLASQTDPLNHTTAYSYDQLGDLATVTAPNTGVTHYTYDTNGERLSVTDPTGAVSQATYDYLGRRLTSTQLVRQPSAATYTTTYTYDNLNHAGQLTTSTTPAGVVTRYGYNHIGETTSITDGANNTTSYGYDAAGHRVSVTLPDGSSQVTAYDGAGRPVSTSDRDASNAVLRTQSTGYDGNGNVVSATDPNGDTSTFTYDATNMVTGEVQPVTTTSSITTSFGYDAAGNRTRFTDGRGNAFLTTYNTWNLPESQTEPATTAYPNAVDRTFTVVYDAVGRLASQLAPGGVSVTDTYDTVGNLTGQTGAGADAPTTARTFGYDLAGRPTTASAPGGTDTFSYDDRGLLLSASGPSGSSSFSYTPDSLLASRTDAAGTTSYTYDGAGRLATVADPATGVTLSWAYNNLSRPARITYGTGGNTRTFGYDALHRLASDTLATSGGTTIASIAYGYDLNGDETSKTTTGFGGTTANTYTYDKARRLTSWSNGTTTTTYGYDASGNRTQVGTQTFSYDQRNELISGGGSSYTYTPRGTLASTVTGAQTVTSTSDAFGQTVTQGNQTYAYDGLGRVVTDATTGAGTRTFAYTGATNTVASDGTATYSWDPGGGLIGVKTGTAGVLAWTDQHTDVVGQFSATGTALSGSSTYDPLGNVTASANFAGNLGYQSAWTERSTGRVNMLSRWYNPATGQFSTRDSVGLDPVPASASANRFAYVNDDPLIATDPDGHCSWYDVVCGAKKVVNTVSNAVSSAWNYVSSGDAFDDLRETAHHVYDAGRRIAQQVVTTTVHVVHTVAHHVRDAYYTVKKTANRYAHDLRHAGAALARGATRYYKAQVHAVKTAYHATAKAVSAGAHFVKQHAAAIASFAVSSLVFVGCEAALGALTAGVGAVAGAVACGALAGAVGGLVDQGAKCAKGGKGACSVKAFGEAVGIGALGGAIGGAVAGSIGGKIASGLLSKGASLLSRTAVGALDGAVTGAVAGGAAGGLTGAVSYGLNCGSHCSLGGFAHAAGDGAISGAIGGAGIGGIAGGIGGARGPKAGEGDGAGERPANPDCRHSFDPYTRVLMADGSTKPIKDVKVGDKVATTDPKTGRSSPRRVVLLHDNHDSDLVDVTVQAADKSITTLHTTWHHPFWNASTGGWSDAARLTAGTRLQTADGATETVVGLRTWLGQRDMRDLTVADVHTYYVIAGTTPVLVHNCTYENNQSENWPQESAAMQDAGFSPATSGTPEFDAVVDSGDPFLWAVREDGTLAVGPQNFNGLRVTHSMLANGDPVLGAGMAQRPYAGGAIRLNSHSGHYYKDIPEWRSGGAVVGVGRSSFEGLGIPTAFRELGLVR